MKVHKMEARKARIEIIPMIDAIFFLLVFFMFSSLSMVRMKGANISLPTTKAAGQGSGPTDKLIVSITQNGDFYLNKTRVSRPDLERDLQAKLRANPNSAIILNLSKNQTTQTLIEVLDVANNLKTPTGGPPPVLIATEAVDSNGNPLKAPLAEHGKEQ